MKKKILLSALIGVLAAGTIVFFMFRPEGAKPMSYYDAYPSFDKVINHYFENYHYHRYWSDRDLKDDKDDQKEKEILRFAKKPDGWHVQFFIVDPGYKVTYDKLFWSGKKKDFVELSGLLKAKSSGPEMAEYFRLQMGDEKDKYDDRVFYGYDGWQDDVLSRFTESDSLRDYVLGGIYWACNELSHAYAGGMKDFRYMLDSTVVNKGTNDDRLAMFKKYKERSLKVAELMIKRAEKEQDGEKLQKRKTMYMEGLLDYHFQMAVNNREKEVLPWFREEAFDPGTLNMAVNLLNSCKPNSVLMVGTTWMSAHMLFEQEVRGFKRDVLVVDNGMLNYSGYYHYIKDKSNKSCHAKLTISDDLYNRHQLSRVVITTNSTGSGMSSYGSAHDLDEVLRRITKRAQHATDTDFVKIDLTNYQLEIDLKAALDNGVIDSTVYNQYVKDHSYDYGYSYYSSSSKSKKDKNTLTWNNENYSIPAGGVFFMDLVANNAARIPIYVTPGETDDAMIGMSSFKASENLVYRIDPAQYENYDEDEDYDYDGESDDSYTTGSYKRETERLYNYYMNTFAWKASAKPTGYELLLADHMRADIADAAARFGNDEASKTKAAALIKRATEIFPESKYPYGPGVQSLCHYYFRHGEKKLAHTVLDSAEAHLNGDYHNDVRIPITDDMYHYTSDDTTDALHYIERARENDGDVYDE